MRSSRGNTICNSVPLSRRAMLAQSSLGIGTLALAHLLAADGLLGGESEPPSRPGQVLDLRPRQGHFPAQAKAVIMLMQNGGPSQTDLFDPKPQLQERNGQKHPDQVESFQPGSQANLLLASPFEFRPHGQCGMQFSALVPHLGSVADELCLVRSMVSDNNNHPQALRCINTGKIFTGRPTLGAWVSYALGSENQNLPAYVALRDPDGYNNGGTTLWDSGWLPATYRGTEIHSRGAPVLNLRPAVPAPAGVQRNNLDLLAKLNERHRHGFPGESELEARIQNYELAARMQLHAEAILELEQESATTRALYGLDEPLTANYGTRCLMARRMVEAGVRFVLVTAPIKPGMMPWDNHGNIKEGLEAICPMVDRPSAALVRDLKQRGLLDTTVVLWAGEFGRLPISQNGNGRDHNRHAFSLLVAGGGFKAGYVHGATDDFGYKAVENRVSCPDLLATILHQLGLDHDRLTYQHHGRQETLTDSPVTGAAVVAGLLQRPLRDGHQQHSHPKT